MPTEGLPFLLHEGLEVTFVPPVLKLPRAARIEEIEDRGGKYVAYFEGITTKTQAEQLEGHYCLVRRADLPENYDAGDHDQFLNVEVIDAAAGTIGHVVRVEENPAHPLLVVAAAEGSNREIIVPLVEEFITSFDEDAATLHVSLPEGLLDL